MPEYEPTQLEDGKEVPWESIARELIGEKFTSESDRVTEAVSAISAKVRKNEPVSQEDIHNLRSSLETLEGTMSRHLESIGEIDPNDQSEAIQRSGRAVVQSFMTISRALNSDTGVTSSQLDYAEEMLSNAQEELDKHR